MSTPILESEIEIEGFNAYVDGVAEYENPYAAGTDAFHAWQDGWDRAYLANWRERELDERDIEILRRRT